MMLSPKDHPRIALNTWSKSPMSISGLHDDIIYEVFLLNITRLHDYSNNSSLTTTRYTSQVCRSWRTLILNMPSIWGRLLIDDHSLDQKTDHWRDEILRRSCNSPLWIRWMICNPHQIIFRRHGTSFFFSVLDKHWDRIQHLSITFLDWEIERDRWQPLLRPAPNLRSCSLISFNLPTPIFALSELPISPIFSNHAPSLYHFTTQCFSFSLSAPWISQLRCLHLPRLFSVFSILSALCSTPLLESLTIENVTTASSTHISVPLPTANLPNLAKFCFKHGELGPLNDILTHIRPADGYIMRCSAGVTSNAFTTGHFKACFSTLSGAIQRFLLTHTVTSFEFSLTSFSFTASATTSCGTENFTITIFNQGVGLFPEDLYHSFPSIVSSCDFALVKTLSLELHGPLLSRPTLYFPFFSLFSTVTKLQTGDSTLRILLDMPPNPENKTSESIIFPLLDGLELDHSDEALCDPDLILEFLWRRKESGKPICQLDIGLLEDWVEDHNMNASLEELTGMEVIWGNNRHKEFSYVCGLGQPDRIFVVPGSDDEFDSSGEEGY
ncbi:hypothetical protein GALMADRAFT_159799 [Galerina marginata CBS 339.88]|uniref:F-box domain-containing protein n=1 Tax=Galerina marginata (strain CBS 339.88) TaxID=685588 RepID=A0A067SSJ7_GALM3|nr:hypothetical protein GALMADRAFT_159799 [Galerina marginata CBS 339.88]